MRPLFLQSDRSDLNSQPNTERITDMSGKTLNPRKAKRALEKCSHIINGRAITVSELAAASPVPIPPFGPQQAAALIQNAFEPGDLIALQAARWCYKKERVVPSLWAHVFERDEYASNIQTHTEWTSITRGDMGAYLRVNPVWGKKGSGSCGLFEDEDIVRFPHLLVEHDGLGLDQQLALLCSLQLPFVSLVTSGSKSIHGLVRLDAEDADEFKSLTRKLHRYLDALGFDQSNKNPSRLSRLPGVMRRVKEGATPSRQELLYLDPNPPVSTCIFDRLQAQPTPA